ncbi:MAG: General secretion pathway protein G [Candidatus Woesebacteria bacterium GW2011_GWB1_43_14]|uniref:General secretion pathway protein G n=1 Tax=Candidatus Woesebacteria bacterium GW2011_GWB1_43_14 TaxID=1618578 RepID=A0A0G1DGN7_9BACT|nr:MAG: fimbrial protein pilin [Candidatus Woesebacteria bacterium GW2011_GWC1_42_9]KKS97040.1 MAG: General secretion pathway protein G [Candidatus Woesebacteria bacterium GW2011_GWB1_43_14]
MNSSDISQKGFTLMELLIVIAVLGVLLTLVSLRLVGPEKQARDTKRQSDLKQYQTLLEIYASANKEKYPSEDGVTLPLVCTNYLGATSCPDDPRQTQNGSYMYSADVSGLRYVVWTKLEKPQVDTYYVFCSDGQAGSIEGSLSVSSGNCPI